ncbi:MAG: hypothetical protein RML56_04960 [Burkholderiales bacterium]|nr:hypothetical protein [Burkholderiales bacterium]
MREFLAADRAALEDEVHLQAWARSNERTRALAVRMAAALACPRASGQEIVRSSNSGTPDRAEPTDLDINVAINERRDISRPHGYLCIFRSRNPWLRHTVPMPCAEEVGDSAAVSGPGCAIASRRDGAHGVRPQG